MMTIGTMPRVLSSFFHPQRRFFSQPAWPHFDGLVTVMAIRMKHAIGRLNGLLRFGAVQAAVTAADCLGRHSSSKYTPPQSMRVVCDIPLGEVVPGETAGERPNEIGSSQSS